MFSISNFISLSGGWMLILKLMVWFEKDWTPLFWEHGPSGSTATVASLMGLHPISLVLFWVSRKNCINGLLPGLDVGPKPATRGGGGEWEPIKISSEIDPSAYIPKSPQTLEPRI